MPNPKKDTASGWAGDTSDFITWVKKQPSVDEVKLEFRDPSKPAQIADLKISHHSLPMDP